jgi:hypothetical protein
MTAQNLTKKVRRPVARSAGRQHLSDHRYYVQCAYRLTMAVISLVALIIVTTNH